MSDIGSKYGRLEILSVASIDGKRFAYCRCVCGVEKRILLTNVKRSVTVSCGCIKRKHSVEAGQRFGRLTVLSLDYSREHGHLKVPVVCDCGTKKTVGVAELSGGVTKSCGCLVIEQVTSLSYKHGGEGSVLYAVWHGMKVRCSNKNRENYKIYGGRGISVCKEWIDSFSSFREWAEAHGYEKGLQIDRIDVNGNYEPANCRWVTPKVNGNNRRDNVLLTAFGETMTMKMWSHDPRCVVTYSTLRQRIGAYKWDHEPAITISSRKNTK